MQKFQRNYRIVFEIGERGTAHLTDYYAQEIIEVAYPFTLEFNLSAGINFGKITSGTFKLYNLAPDVRAKLWKDNFNQKKYVTMWVYAGYGDNTPLIFKGDILECYSYRQSGDTNYITTIKSDDGSYLFQYGMANRTFNEGTEFDNILKTLLAEIPQYKVGYITPSIKPLKRNQTFIGQTMDLLGREYGGYQIFIDKGELNILDTNDVVPGDLLVLTAESGLLGSPRRENLYLEVDVIFEPRIKIGQAIELISDSLPFVNNIYKVVGLTHSGTISPVECGKVITTVQLYMGTEPFNALKSATVGEEETTENTKNDGWVNPLKAKYSISGRYGDARYKKGKYDHDHKGIDMATYTSGVPVYAAADGKVSICYNDVGGYGNVVYVNHGKGANGKIITSRYGHLTKWTVSPGQQLYKGTTIIGYVGSTGYSSGPHLHFEIRENEKAVNPLQYINL